MDTATARVVLDGNPLPDILFTEKFI